MFSQGFSISSGVCPAVTHYIGTQSFCRLHFEHCRKDCVPERTEISAPGNALCGKSGFAECCSGLVFVRNVRKQSSHEAQGGKFLTQGIFFLIIKGHFVRIKTACGI